MLDDYLKLVTYTTSITVGSGKNGNASDYVILDGYTPIGIIEIDHDSDGYVELAKWSIVNGRSYVSMTNNYTQSRTFNVKYKVVFMRNDFYNKCIS